MVTVFGVVIITLGGVWGNVWSEEVSPPLASGTLEQRLSILERKLEVAEEAAADKAKTATKPSAGTDGFSFKSVDGNFGIKFHALLQADGRFFVDDNAGNETDQFLLRRVRPSIDGTFYRDFAFNVVPDFANNGSTVLVDAYLDVKPWTFAQLRVGKFKPAIGLEHLQSDPNTIFPERSLVSTLLPGRDTGMQFSGEVANGAIGYAAGISNGNGDNNSTGDTDTNDGKEGTSRIYAKPFKNTPIEALQGLHLGLGASYAKQNVAAPTYRSSGQQTIFTPTAAAVVDGEKTRLAPEFAWYYRSVGVLGEWAQSSQVYRVGTVRSRIVNQGWQAAVAWTITGEDTTFTGVKPRKPFDVQTHQWGAWQLAARYHSLHLDPDNVTRGITTNATSVQWANAYTLGVNWYLNSIVRFSAEFENTTFDKGATTGDKPNEKLALARWQINF